MLINDIFEVGDLRGQYVVYEMRFDVCMADRT
jgi:hypothetical protein